MSQLSTCICHIRTDINKKTETVGICLLFKVAAAIKIIATYSPQGIGEMLENLHPARPPQSEVGKGIKVLKLYTGNNRFSLLCTSCLICCHSNKILTKIYRKQMIIYIEYT